MKRTDKKNDFLMQGSILAAAGIIVRLIGLMYRVPLTRIVGSEGMGYYNTAYEIYSLVLLLSSYSIPVALSKLISSSEAKKEYHNSYRIFLSAMCIAVVAGGAASALLFFGADMLATMIGWPSAAIPLKVLAPTILVFAVMGVLRGFFQGKRMMFPTAISQIVEQLVNAAVSIIAAVLLIQAYKDTASVAAYGAAGGMLGTFTGTLAGLLVLVLVFVINKETVDRQVSRDKTIVTENFRSTIRLVALTMLPIILGQTIYQISGTVDNIMFGTLMAGSEAERAILWESYSNKYKWLYNVPVAVSTAIGTSIVPSLIATYTEGNLKLVKQKIASAVKFNMLIAIPAAVGLGILAKPILVLLFNNAEDVISPDLMRLGSIAVVFFALSTLTNGVFQGINRMRIPVIHALVSLIVHVIVLYFLLDILQLGAYGLVIGNVTYALLVCILNWVALEKAINYRQELKKTFILPALAAACMGVVTHFGYQGLVLLTGSNTIATFSTLIISVFVYFIALIITKAVSKEELSSLPKGKLLVKICKKLHLIR